MKLSLNTIDSVLSSYGLSLSEEELNQLKRRVETQNRLNKMLISSENNVESFALKPRWTTPKSLVNEEADLPISNCVGKFENPWKCGQILSPKQAVEKSLQIVNHHPKTNVFIKVFRKRAWREAKRLEKKDKSDLPLWGTTVAIKDLIAISGHRMTAGSQVFDESPFNFEAPVVKRLRRAGAVIIGAANLHELAFGTTSINPHFGTVVNPIDKDFLAGGSSGGSAAAVGFGMASFALGTDTGGSIRIPAACCGIVGFKPSFGLLSLDGVFPLGYTLDHVGPLANSVRQAALIAEAMAGQPRLFGSSQSEAIDNLKIGVPANFFLEGIQEEVRSAYQKALDQLQASGADLIRVKLPYHRLAPVVYLCTSGPEALGVHFKRVIKRGSRMGQDVYIRLLAALFIPAYVRVRAQQVRNKMYLELQDIFQQVDVLATPTLPITVPQVGAKTLELNGHSVEVGLILLRNTSPFNLTGVPAVTLPFDKDKNGMPFSLQLVGPYGEDGSLLQAAYTIEQVLS